MTEQTFEMRIEATLEIRDADGNLISATPVQSTRVVTESERAAIIKDGART